ncbi:MAG: hypothetical protein QOH41_1482 [Blastocatellia bacterium]|jgi:hypothetical protein|nr:hypothetical protein [Blastocatellia bacterium]
MIEIVPLEQAVDAYASMHCVHPMVRARGH